MDFTPLPGTIEDDLATRDFTINAIAVPLAGRRAGRSLTAGAPTSRPKVIRAVSPSVFARRPAAAPACGAARGRARLPAGAGDGAARSRARRARDAAGARADAGRAGAAVRGGLPASRRAWSAGPARRLERRPRPRARSSIVPPFGSSRSSATRSGAFRCRTRLKRYARALLRARAARGRISARDLPLSAGDRAVGARCAGLRRAL